MENNITKFSDAINKNVDPFFLFIQSLEQLKNIQQSAMKESSVVLSKDSPKIAKDQLIDSPILKEMQSFLQEISDKIKIINNKQQIEDQFTRNKELLKFSNIGLTILNTIGVKTFDFTFNMQNKILNCQNSNEYYTLCKQTVSIFQKNISSLKLNKQDEALVLQYIKEYLNSLDQIEKKIFEVEDHKSSTAVIINSDNLNTRDSNSNVENIFYNFQNFDSVEELKKKVESDTSNSNIGNILYDSRSFNSLEDAIDEIKTDKVADQILYIIHPLLLVLSVKFNKDSQGKETIAIFDKILLVLSVKFNEDFQGKETIAIFDEIFPEAQNALKCFQETASLANIRKIEEKCRVRLEDVLLGLGERDLIVSKEFLKQLFQFENFNNLFSKIRLELERFSQDLSTTIQNKNSKINLTEYLNRYSQIINKMEEKLNEIYSHDKNQNDNNVDKSKEEKKLLEELNSKLNLTKYLDRYSQIINTMKNTSNTMDEKNQNDNFNPDESKKEKKLSMEFKKNNNRLNELNSKILTKEEDIKSKENQNENNEDTIERNNKSIEKKTNEIDDSNAHSVIEKLSEEIENKRSEITKLNNNNNFTEEKLNRLRGELQNALTILQNGLVNLQSNLKRLNANKVKLQNQYKKFQSEIKKLNPLLLKNNLRLQGINDGLIIHNNFFKENEEKLKEIDSELSKNSALIASKEDNKKNQYRWDDKDKSQKSIENEIEKLKSKNNELYSEKEKLDTENQETKKIIDEYKKEKALLENHNIDIQNRVQYYKEEIKNNQIEQKKIKDEIDSLVTQNPKEKKVIEERNKLLEKEILLLTEENQRLQNDILPNEKIILKLKEEIKNNKKKIHVIKKENDNLREEIALVKSCNINDGYKSSSSESENSKNIKEKKDDDDMNPKKDPIPPRNFIIESCGSIIESCGSSIVDNTKKIVPDIVFTKSDIKLLKKMKHLPKFFKDYRNATLLSKKDLVNEIIQYITQFSTDLEALKGKISNCEMVCIRGASEDIKEELLFVYNELDQSLREKNKKIITSKSGLFKYFCIIGIEKSQFLEGITYTGANKTTSKINNFIVAFNSLVETLEEKSKIFEESNVNNLDKLNGIIFDKFAYDSYGVVSKFARH